MPPNEQTPTSIKWHEVTWYSKLGAIILFIGVVPALCFYIGTQYESVYSTLESAPVVSNNAVSNTPCNLLFSNKLTSDTQLPISCPTDIGNGVTPTYQLEASGTLLITQNGKTILSLDPSKADDADDIEIVNNNAFQQNSFIFSDINYDGYLDFGVEKGSSGANNIHYDFYTYSVQKGVYELTALLPELTNPTIDSVRKTITTHENEGGGGDFYIDDTYTFNSGKYALTGEVNGGGDACTGLIRTTKELRDGRLIVTKTENLGPDSVFCQTQ